MTEDWTLNLDSQHSMPSQEGLAMPQLSAKAKIPLPSSQPSKENSDQLSHRVLWEPQPQDPTVPREDS